ncbi:hypothetical protein CEV32_1138 [Brucella rhizosphaerae]|uniref:Uncharacterized protein n=1 Tax=Brucella rhizosphaerae TaxID=571254 RepID=A0A256FDL5_9HYPH|nr:hypothetical protein CEV32_1138 [Brucella rhizosphaerae]
MDFWNLTFERAFVSVGVQTSNSIHSFIPNWNELLRKYCCP